MIRNQGLVRMLAPFATMLLVDPGAVPDDVLPTSAVGSIGSAGCCGPRLFVVAALQVGPFPSPCSQPSTVVFCRVGFDPNTRRAARVAGVQVRAANASAPRERVSLAGVLDQTTSITCSCSVEPATA